MSSLSACRVGKPVVHPFVNTTQLLSKSKSKMLIKLRENHEKHLKFFGNQPPEGILISCLDFSPINFSLESFAWKLNKK